MKKTQQGKSNSRHELPVKNLAPKNVSEVKGGEFTVGQSRLISFDTATPSS